MYIIQCKSYPPEVWANKPGSNFIHSVSKYFSVKYAEEITDADLDIYEVDAGSENARLALLAHHRNHHHEGYKLNGPGRNLDLVDITPEVRVPAELRVGDNDPLDPGTPVAGGDPRTRPTITPRSESVRSSVSLKRVVSFGRKQPTVTE